jgi:hypothetical protein
MMHQFAVHGQDVPLDSAATITGPTWPSPSQRDSEASTTSTESEFNEITLEDDVRFSTVPLTARPTRKSFFEKVDEFRRRSAESVRASLVGAGKLQAHKKSISEVVPSSLQFTPISSDLSDVQEADASADQPAQDDLQEPEIPAVRDLQHEQPLEDDHVLPGAIDWGMRYRDIRRACHTHYLLPLTDFWGAVISGGS